MLAIMNLNSVLGRIDPRNRNWVIGKIFELRGNVYRAEGLEFEIPKDIMPTSLKSRFVLDTYERPERNLTRRFVKPGDSILELGSCLGIVSCFANRLLKNPEQHVALEANPSLIPVIERNRKLNNCKFTTIHGAIGDGNDLEFWVNRIPTASSGVSKRGERIKVPTFTLDALRRRVPFDFSCLLMDIEGAEAGVLASFLPQMESIRTIIVETHPAIYGIEGNRRVERCLVEAGYSCQATEGTVGVWSRQL